MTEEIKKEWWTITTEGDIPPIKIGGIEMPVKTHPVKNDRTIPVPKRTKDGFLIYAVPGGGSYANGEFL